MNDRPGYDYQVLLRRNQHGGICEDIVRGKEVKRYRSSQDARLFASLTPDQETSFYQIATAYTLRTQGLGATISKYDDFVKATGQGNLEYGAEQLMKYDSWTRACKGKSINFNTAVNIIVFGQSPNEVDRTYRVGNGTSKKELIRALDVWAEV